jgi:hypothetical protein
MSKKKKTKNFDEFESENIAATSNYEPPKYVAKPAPGDKGFALVSASFKNQKRYFEPNIRSVNKDLDVEN